MNELNSNTEKREKIFSEIAKKYGIRAVKPEYHIILNTLQTISPTTIKELQDEINNEYEFEIFTYKQLYDLIRSLTDDGIIKNNFITKQISINPEYISYSESLPVSSFCIAVLGISGIFLIISFATEKALMYSLIAFVVALIQVLGQHFGNKFSFNSSR